MKYSSVFLLPIRLGYFHTRQAEIEIASVLDVSFEKMKLPTNSLVMAIFANSLLALHYTDHVLALIVMSLKQASSAALPASSICSSRCFLCVLPLLLSSLHSLQFPLQFPRFHTSGHLGFAFAAPTVSPIQSTSAIDDAVCQIMTSRSPTLKRQNVFYPSDLPCYRSFKVSLCLLLPRHSLLLQPILPLYLPLLSLLALDPFLVGLILVQACGGRGMSA